MPNLQQTLEDQLVRVEFAIERLEQNRVAGKSARKLLDALTRERLRLRANLQQLSQPH